MFHAPSLTTLTSFLPNSALLQPEPAEKQCPDLVTGCEAVCCWQSVSGSCWDFTSMKPAVGVSAALVMMRGR